MRQVGGIISISDTSVIERKSTPMHNPISNGAQSFVQVRSSSRTEAAMVDAPLINGRVDSTNRGLSSKIQPITE